HLVENVLEYGREGAGEANVTLTGLDLRSLATETINLIRPQATAKGISLTLTLTPDGPVWIRSDHTKLWRILLNLLG
ncbi:MAG: hypothetical protein J0626_07815, partial [Rhodospirillaceae bacterium]|nr:hypothetical protein [Rhodospirillaceae bacterium]